MRETYIKGYLVNEEGQVFSAKIPSGQGKLNYNALHELSYKIDRYGYKTVCLSFLDNNNKQKRIYPTVHSLIYKTFYGDIPNNYHIDYINNDKLDNYLCNLRAIPAKENSIKRNTSHHFGHENKWQIYDYNTNHNYQLTTTQPVWKYEISRKAFYGISFRPNQTSSKQLQNRGVYIKVTKCVEDIERD